MTMMEAYMKIREVFIMRPNGKWFIIDPEAIGINENVYWHCKEIWIIKENDMLRGIVADFFF